jgi:hypothetical protein
MKDTPIPAQNPVTRRTALITGLSAAIGLPLANGRENNSMQATLTDDAESTRRGRRNNNVHAERIVVLLDELKAECSAIEDENLSVGIDSEADGFELHEAARSTLWVLGLIEASFESRLWSFYGVKTPAEVRAIEERLQLGVITERYFERIAADVRADMEQTP